LARASRPLALGKSSRMHPQTTIGSSQSTLAPNRQQQAKDRSQLIKNTVSQLKKKSLRLVSSIAGRTEPLRCTVHDRSDPDPVTTPQSDLERTQIIKFIHRRQALRRIAGQHPRYRAAPPRGTRTASRGRERSSERGGAERCFPLALMCKCPGTL
jgi:hypothetical protein